MLKIKWVLYKLGGRKINRSGMLKKKECVETIVL